MEFNIGSIFSYLTAVAIVILTCIIIYYRWIFNYWKKKGVFTPPPSIPFGNIGQVFYNNKPFPNVIMELHQKIRSKGLKYGGAFMFAKPAFVPVDPDIIKRILLTDFSHFINHGGYVNEEVDPLTYNLFTLSNDTWRNLRVKMTPVFTSGKMRMMFETLLECTHSLKVIMDEMIEKKAPIDIKDVLARFGMDVIGTCAFGIEFKTMQNPDSLFRHYGRMLLEPNLAQNARNLIQGVFPSSLLKAIRFRVHPREAADFFLNVVKEAVEYREKNNVFRKDFLHLMIQLKNLGEVSEDGVASGESKGGIHLTIPQITAQCFSFFTAGYESTSSSVSFALFELANNQEVQEKTREEINRTVQKHNGQLTYEVVKELTYMDMVLKETLRMYPPLPILLRQCNKRYEVPGESLVIEEGDGVMVPILGIQRDPEYYPNPDVFDPDRFSDEEKTARHPFTWLPFGEGPRNCIGMRFGLMQAKVALALLLRNYRILLNKKTQVPIEFDKDGFLLAVKGKIWIDAEKIQ